MASNYGDPFLSQTGCIMTKTEYRTALETLGLSQLAAGRWLGVSNKTAQRYATEGPTGPAAKAIQMALAFGLELPPAKPVPPSQQGE